MKEHNRLLKTENVYICESKEFYPSIIYQARERRLITKPIFEDNDIRTNGGLNDKLKRYSTPRNGFNKSNYHLM